MQSSEYLLPFSGSLLHMQQTGNRVLCRLIMQNGQIFFSHAPKWPMQPLLPFPEVIQRESILQNIEIMAPRIFKVADKMTTRRQLVVEFCVKAGLPGIELLESCPAIALLLAVRWNHDPSVRSFSRCAELAGMKRHEILRYCRYPSAKWIVGLLQKIPLAHCSAYLLDDLREIIEKNIPDQIKILKHLPQLSRLTVSVLKDDAASAHVARGFFRSASTYPETDGDIEADYLLYEILRMSDELPDIQVPLIRDVRDLRRIHDLYVEQYQLVYGKKNMDQIFGNPPVAECILSGRESQAGIYPVTTMRELFHEGEHMMHCVATYAWRITRNKNLFVYHVDSPNGEEATVMIQKNEKTAHWRIAEIRGVHNLDVSNKTLHFVEEWLTAHNQRQLEGQEREIEG